MDIPFWIIAAVIAVIFTFFTVVAYKHDRREGKLFPLRSAVVVMVCALFMEIFDAFSLLSFSGLSLALLCIAGGVAIGTSILNANFEQNPH